MAPIVWGDRLGVAIKCNLDRHPLGCDWTKALLEGLTSS